jgi:predicted component of type VI protein secretion system
MIRLTAMSSIAGIDSPPAHAITGTRMNMVLLVKQGRPAGKALQFGPGEYYLGRGEECHVRFNSDWVSRQHCQLVVGADAALLTDLGSRNGTLVNGELLQQEWPLKNGDLIHVGPVVFEVRLETPSDPEEITGPAVIRAPEDILPPEIIPLSSTAHQPALRPSPPEEAAT